MNTNNWSLVKIIDNCKNPESQIWEGAWEEFLNRYKKIIYFFITRSCQSWKMRRLKLQFNDVVNDIYSDVIITIYKKLESFRNTDSELKLMAWMQVICSRSATAYMNRKMKNLLYDDSFEEITNLQLRESQNEQWELYEYFISKLRNALKSKKSAEVYIHLFMLKIWNGLSNSQIAAHPCFNSFSDNRINVIINRVREKILKEM